MKKFFNFLLLFLLVASSLFGQSWGDLPQTPISPILLAINGSPTNDAHELLLGGDFTGTMQGLSSPKVMKFNGLTNTLSAVSGFSTSDIVKDFYHGSGSRVRVFGNIAGNGIAKFSNTNNSITAFEAPLTGPSGQVVDAAATDGVNTIVFGKTLQQINGVALSGSNSVALLNGVIVTHLSNLQPSGASSDIKVFQPYGTGFIGAGDFTSIGTTPCNDIFIWDGTNVIPITGAPAGGFITDIELPYVGTTSGVYELIGTNISPFGITMNVRDLHIDPNGDLIVVGTKLPGGPATRVMKNLTDIEGLLVFNSAKNSTGLSFYAAASTPSRLVIGGGLHSGVSHCTNAAQYTSIPLPITLSSFEVEQTNNGNEISWNTEKEINSYSFEIESSMDGKNFKKIGFIYAKNEPSDYSFLDDHPYENSYYRLKEVDLDGKFKYSVIIFIQNKGFFVEKIYPSPFLDELNIETKESEIVIYDNFGKIVLGMTNFNEGNSSLDLSYLKSGTYAVKIGNKIHRIQKL